MIKKILSNVSNKVKAIYLLWILINLSLFFFNTNKIKSNFDNHRYHSSTVDGEVPHSRVFFPFTSPDILDMKYVVFYDITEFIFYAILPIFIYVIIKLFTNKDKQYD